jgi:hypothetical protein
VFPLSVIKLYVAAMWWDRGGGDGSLRGTRRRAGFRRRDREESHDRPVREMAVVLRRKIGAEAMLAGLAGTVSDRLRRLTLAARRQRCRFGETTCRSASTV